MRNNDAPWINAMGGISYSALLTSSQGLLGGFKYLVLRVSCVYVCIACTRCTAIRDARFARFLRARQASDWSTKLSLKNECHLLKWKSVLLYRQNIPGSRDKDI